MNRTGWMMVAAALLVAGEARGESGGSVAASCAAAGTRACVVDGDTFRMGGERIRIADIDAPETHPARCPAEAALGRAAAERLAALLNAGPFTLERGSRDRDRYGRALRIVMRDGRSIGAMLVTEGLARPWERARQPWCGRISGS